MRQKRAIADNSTVIGMSAHRPDISKNNAIFHKKIHFFKKISGSDCSGKYFYYFWL